MTRIALTLFALFTLATGCAAPIEGDSTIGEGDEALSRLNDAGMPTCCAIVAGDPPVPPQPPVPTAGAAGRYDTSAIRLIMQVVGDQTIAATNARLEAEGAPATLEWAPGARPWECGYSCAHTPWLLYTQSWDQPNYWYVQYEVRLHFKLDLPATLERDIYVNVPFRFTCNGWETGYGTMTATQQSPQVWSEGGDALEGVIDFLSPVSLSRFIDSKVRENLPSPSGGSTLPIGNPSCSSLGEVDGYPDAEGYWLDAVVWDIPRAPRVHTRIPGRFLPSR